MTDEILEYIFKHRIGICTSLDGPKELHDKNRPYTCSSHDIVSRWIKKLNKDKDVINALLVITRHSLKYPKEIVDEYIKHDLKVIQLKMLTKLGYAMNNIDNIGYEAEEFLDFWKKAMDYIIEKNKEGYPLKETITQHIVEKIFTDHASNYLDLHSPCGAIIGQLAYAQDGSIYTCDEGRMHDIFRIGNVKDNTFKEVVTSDQACSFIALSSNESFLCDACVFKPYCGLCPVGTYSETGNMIPQLANNYRCKILMGMFEYIFDKIMNDKDATDVFKSWIVP
jgi:radical SAM protein with 4Fe4S-binding SPASM domain